MRILVAPDKFKGSLGAAEVAESIAAGLREGFPAAEITCCPVADGGEGTAKVICSAANGEWHTCKAHDAYGNVVTTRFATVDAGETAVLETSEAIGLWRVPAESHALERASSFGVGDMILAAARSGAKKLIVGLGGSATNDGGFGLARAFGFRFLDENGNELTGSVFDLLRVARIERPHALGLPAVIAAADVRNPLLGENGATRVFAAQKGATGEEIELLENALTRLAEVVARDLGVDHREAASAGAAGGLGFGLASFCGATLCSGFEVVSEAIGLESRIQGVDVVVTGEGRLDAQTLKGKAPAGVAKVARRRGKRCYAIVGEFVETAGLGEIFDGIFVLSGAPADGMANAVILLRERGRELGRILGGVR